MSTYSKKGPKAKKQKPEKLKMEKLVLDPKLDKSKFISDLVATAYKKATQEQTAKIIHEIVERVGKLGIEVDTTSEDTTRAFLKERIILAPYQGKTYVYLDFKSKDDMGTLLFFYTNMLSVPEYDFENTSVSMTIEMQIGTTPPKMEIVKDEPGHGLYTKSRLTNAPKTEIVKDEDDRKLVTCHYCDGTGTAEGTVDNYPCTSCDGKGYLDVAK
jgi:hypothetical protein